MNTAATKKRYVISQKLNGGKSKKAGKSSEKHGKIDGFGRKKIIRINKALDEDPVDIDLIRKLMVSAGGCVTNDIRCKVWPKLLNLNIFERPRRVDEATELQRFKENKWWNQVIMDVNRSQRRFETGIRITRRRALQKQLTNVIMRVLCRNDELHYYQGFHDIAVTLLRVVGEDLASLLLEQISKTYIRDFMDKNMNRTNKMLTFFYAILSKVDKELEQFMLSADVGVIFALSWLITWYGHDINSFEVIVRLFDVFLSHNPILPIYVAVVLALTHRETILECENDMPIVHHCMSKLPLRINESNIENVITEACNLFKQHPPESLKRDVRKYLTESDTVQQHAILLYNSYYQKPDNVLRRRKKLSAFANQTNNLEIQKQDSKFLHKDIHQTNPIVKAAVWTMTVSIGVVTYLVLNTNKYWL